MAAAFVQELARGSGSAGSLTLTLGAGVNSTINNHVLLIVAISNSTATVSIADTQGNTYATDVTGTNAGGPERTYVCSARLVAALLSGTTIVLTASAGLLRAAVAIEVSGLNQTTWLDASGSKAEANGATALSVTTSGNAAQADEFVLAGFSEGSGNITGWAAD